MYGQCLVTPTILDSYEFAVNAPPSWKATAEEGFLARLRREKADYPLWVGKGLKFEDAVYKSCRVHYKDRFEENPIQEGSQHFRDVCAMCIGGTFQEKLSKKMDIAGEQAFLFGYTDVSFPSITLDIKTTLNYKGPAKYLKGHQHLLYSFMRETPNFTYIIAQWESEDSNTIQAIHTIDYEAPTMDKLEKTIVDKIGAFFDYLRDEGLWLDYYHTFSKN